MDSERSGFIFVRYNDAVNLSTECVLHDNRYLFFHPHQHKLTVEKYSDLFFFNENSCELRNTRRASEQVRFQREKTENLVKMIQLLEIYLKAAFSDDFKIRKH